MSHNLKDKMLNYQVPPPEGLWESIAFELDKEETSTATRKLNNYEVTPPAFIWNKIEAALDKDKEETLIIAHKLNNHEVAPPAFIWSKIEEELDKEDNKVIEFMPKAKVFTLGRIAAAASIALILGVSVWFFNQNQKPTVDTAIATNTTKNNNTSVTPNATTNSNPVLTSDIQDKKKESKNSTDINIKEKQIEVSEELATTNPSQDLAKNPFENKEEKLVNKQGETPENIDLVSTPNSYLTIVGPNGQSVRISSKFSKQIGLFTETDPDKMENIDFIIVESAMWRSKIAKWRSKMNIADVSPSLSNFMDILELSKKVDTDKKK